MRVTTIAMTLFKMTLDTYNKQVTGIILEIMTIWQHYSIAM